MSLKRAGEKDRTVVILQSNYVPWRGYFDLIGRASVLILYDDMQFTKRDWRNRNRIKTAAGLRWLTIPVETKGAFHQPIKQVQTAGDGWRSRHWEMLRHAYGRAAHFKELRALLEPLYLGSSERSLSKINHSFLTAICAWLGIDTEIRWSMEFELAEDRTERLIALCKEVSGDRYLSGPSARNYMDEDAFRGAGLGLSYMCYGPYPEYSQFYPPFEGQVSILDLLFHQGREAARSLLPLEALDGRTPSRD